MRRIECQFEADVLAAALQSRWPDRVDPELREHAKTCVICGDVAAVAGAIDRAREETMASTSLRDTIPDSGRVWWKAQLRARKEAAEAVARPITAVQLAAFACAIGLMGACVGATSSWFQTALKWAWSQVTAFDVKAVIPYATALIAAHGLLVLSMLAMIFVVPVAVYFVVGRD